MEDREWRRLGRSNPPIPGSAVSLLFSPLVEEALRVAARCHAGQTRKGCEVPYLTHPAAVALILARAGFDEDDVLAAAILHDVVEDSDYSMAELERDFPAPVLAYVAALTERKRDEQGNRRDWESRKREHIAEIAGAPLPARAIALADKLHNLGTMVYDLQRGTNVWERFNAPSERIRWYYSEMIAAAAQEDPALASLANACRALLARLERSAAG